MTPLLLGGGLSPADSPPPGRRGFHQQTPLLLGGGVRGGGEKHGHNLFLIGWDIF